MKTWAQGGGGGLAPLCPGGKGRAPDQNSLRDQPKDYKKKMIMPPGGLPRKGPGDPLGEEHLAPLKVSFNILLIYISL